MGSINYGKSEIVHYILENYDDAVILDVGACDGKWWKLLGPFYTMDAVEIFEPNIINSNLRAKYRNVFNCDILDLKYDFYDVVIFGDVIEHMTVENAQKVLEYAKKHSKLVVVGVPFMWKQAEQYGNKWELHIQDDLTNERFMDLYPGFELFMNESYYGWYIWKEGEAK